MSDPHQEFCGQVDNRIIFNGHFAQPKPVLIGFNSELEKEFFEGFITVEDIGPATAVKCLTMGIPNIARAIEERDARAIQGLKGVGARKADKIIATLRGKVGKFALMRYGEVPSPPETEDLRTQVKEVLVRDLGHRASEANRMVDEALRRNPTISTPEELFEEVYRAEKE